MPVPNLPDDPNDPGDPSGGGGGTPPAQSFGTTVFDINFNKIDASSALDVIAYLNCYNQDDLQFSAYLFLDETLYQVGTVNAIFDNTNSKAQQTMTIVCIIESIPAGAHNVKIRVKNRETEGPLVVQAGSVIKIQELRQAAR